VPRLMLHRGMLDVRRLSKRYSGIPAVQDVSFIARAGEITGYLGPNGSGKSSTMKMLAGLTVPTSGEILFAGRPIAEDLVAYHRRMGYVPEEPYLYTHLSGLEYLRMVAQLHGLVLKKARLRIDALLHAFGLSEDGEAMMSGYSKGMRQKVLIAAALLHDPDLVILDEPFSGLDINSALLLRSLMEELARRGKVVLCSAHELDTVEKICSRVVILHQGCVVADDSIANLRSMMAAPNLESVFAQLTVVRDVQAASRELMDVIHD
jgi:ABC-2 type transport system ATP-binding protein